MLLIATIIFLASNTSEIPRISRRVRPAHEDRIRQLIENNYIPSPPPFALPDTNVDTVKNGTAPEPSKAEVPKFVEIPKNDYDDFKKAIQALRKLLKPESMETLKRLTTTIVDEKARELGGGGYGAVPDKLATLVQSAVSFQKSVDDDKTKNKTMDSWIHQMAQGGVPGSLQEMPPAFRLQQSLAQGAAQPGSPASPFLPVYYQNIPLAQDASFRQLSPPGYQTIPYFQLPSSTQHEYNSEPPVEFRSPLQTPTLL